MLFGSKYVYTKTDAYDRDLSDEEVYVREDDRAVLSASSGCSDDEGEDCLLDIFDTAGQEEYSALREQYVRSGDGFVIVFSVTDEASFQEAESIFAWLKRFQSKFYAVLCGNKTDLTDERKVKREDGQKLADSQGVPYVETSAKTGENVSDVYQRLMKTIPRTGSEYKVVMLGSGCVGKSSITLRFTQNTFLDDYDPTIEDSYRKMIQVSDQPRGSERDKKAKRKKVRAFASSSKGKAAGKRPARKAKGRSRSSSQERCPPLRTAQVDMGGGRGIFGSLRHVFSRRNTNAGVGSPSPVQQQQQQVFSASECTAVQTVLLGGGVQTKGKAKKSEGSGSDSEDDSEEEAQMERRRRRREKQRKADGNVVLISLGQLGEDPNLVTGDPVRCKGCDAVLSSTSTLTPQEDGKKMWICEFCGHKNLDLDVEDEEIPQGERFDFMLEPATAVEVDEAAGASGSDAKIKKKATKGHTIYCMDVSSSMGVSCEIPEFQAAWRVERTRGQSQVSNVSRLTCIKEAVQRQLEQMHTDQPDKPVMLAAFGSEMKVKGGGVGQTRRGTYDFRDLDRTAYDSLLDKGKELAGNYPLQPLADSYTALKNAVEQLRTEGCTALGPALAICAGFISEVPGSEIILCTDGMPNVGVGSLQSGRHEPEFYRQIGEYAKANKTVINILAVEGEQVGLPHVQVAAEASGGTINVLNPLEIVRQLRQIMQNSLVANCVTITFFLHPDFVFDEPGYPDDSSRLSKELGNVMKEDDMTFRFKPKDPKKELNMEQVPFQVQITYTRPDGMKCLRILSKSNQATVKREDMEEGVNVSVLGAAAVKRTAALAKRSDAHAANAHLKAVKRLAKRGATTSDQREELYAFRDECIDLDRELLNNMKDWGSVSASHMETRMKMLHSKAKTGQARYQNASSKACLAQNRVVTKSSKDLYYNHKF